MPESEALDAADQGIFAMLETAFGNEIGSALGRYLMSSDALCERLQNAAECAYWQEAVRAAVAIGKEAEGMGFHRIAKAARHFADATYHSDAPAELRNEAQMVVFEYERFRLALMARFPGIATLPPGFIA